MASRHPPTPSFGGAYSGLSYMPSQLQQNGYTRPPASSPLAAPQPSIAGTPQFLNASSFETNAQHPSPGLTLPPFPPHSFPPELLKQLVNSSLPPPPPPSFPPVPIPSLGFSPFQARPSLPNNLTPPQNHMGSSMTSDNCSSVLNTIQPQPTFAQASEEIIGSREEGELSDGELEDDLHADRSQTVSQEDAANLQMLSHNNKYAGPQQQASSARSLARVNQSSMLPRSSDIAQDPGKSSNNRSQHNPGLGSAPNHQQEDEQDTLSSGREESGSSYDPPSVVTPDLPPDQPTTSNGERSAAQMKELAKGALLSLAPHGIRFSEMVKEGIDPSLLQQLYEELGIRDIRLEGPANSSAHIAVMSGTQKLSDEPELPSSNGVASTPYGREVTSDVTGVFKSLEAKPDVLASNLDPANTGKGTSSQSQEPEKVLKPSAPSPLVIARPDIAMERKDRIAQLLAAKTGKAPPVRSTTDRSTPSSQASPSLATTSELRPLVPPATNVATPTPATQQIPKSLKNKAQTELVRQKMESLKKEAEAKARAQRQSEALLPPKPDMSASTEAATIGSNIPQQSIALDPDRFSLANQDRPSSQTRHVPSGVAPGSEILSTASNSYRIPGLFMTFDEAADVGDNLSSTLMAQAENNSHFLASVPQGPDQSSPVAITPDSTAAGHEILTESNLADFEIAGSTNRSSQKRPLASDLFDESTPPAKRPFGRKDSVEHVEINVSDEDSIESSEGIGMDIDEDSQASGLLSSNASATKEIEQGAQSTPLVDRTAQLPPSPPSAINSSVNLSTPTKEKEKEDLWRAKNLEIEAMRKKIAEMEQRRKAKRSQGQVQSPQTSLPGTPAPNAANAIGVPITPKPSIPARSIQNSPQPVPQSNPATLQHAAQIQPQLPANLARNITESHSQAQDKSYKTERRRNLQEGIPKLDAEVQATQLKLAQTRARLAAVKREAEKREAEIREARKREAEIMEEARRLEEQLEMGLNGQDRFSEELQSLDANTEEQLDNVPSPSEDIVATTIDQGGNSAHEGPLQDTSLALKDLDASENITDALNGEIDAESKEKEEESQTGENESFGPGEAMIALLSSRESPSRALDVLKEPSHPPASFASEQWPYDPGNSPHGDFRSPAHISEQLSDVIKDDMEAINNEYDGSVSMSDGGSEDYEPVVVSESGEALESESDGYEPDDGPVLEAQDRRENSDVDDDYEPTEEVQPLEVHHKPSDINPSYPVSEIVEPIPIPQGLSESNSQSNAELPAADDTEDGLQLSEANTMTKPQEYLPPADEVAQPVDVSQEHQATVTHFTPYESPLSILKNFRFNPRFTELVAGGYRSLTYSNKINPERPLCPIELAGGDCANPKCEEQHFRQMILPDDKILVEMSSASDFKQKEQRDQYLTGLKQVIAELRLRGEKRFEEVADELASYRRRFLANHDPDRTIPS